MGPLHIMYNHTRPNIEVMYEQNWQKVFLYTIDRSLCMKGSELVYPTFHFNHETNMHGYFYSRIGTMYGYGKIPISSLEICENETNDQYIISIDGNPKILLEDLWKPYTIMVVAESDDNLYFPLVIMNVDFIEYNEEENLIDIFSP